MENIVFEKSSPLIFEKNTFVKFEFCLFTNNMIINKTLIKIIFDENPWSLKSTQRQ